MIRADIAGDDRRHMHVPSRPILRA
jgi:hypothetical protein